VNDDLDPVTAAQLAVSEMHEAAFLERVRTVMADKNARALFWWLLGEIGTYSAVYVPNDTHGTAFNEGQRNVGLMIENVLNRANPRILLDMQREALDEKERLRFEREAAEKAGEAERQRRRPGR